MQDNERKFFVKRPPAVRGFTILNARADYNSVLPTILKENMKPAVLFFQQPVYIIALVLLLALI